MSEERLDGRVAVVTGGGGGIGAAIAMELGRRGAHVVTVDPMVTVDGTGTAEDTGPTTADRIVSAGGSAQASNASVTDRDAVDALFDELATSHGSVDAVVNVAGITRRTGFGRGADEDWGAVLSVHLDGYVNLLRAALPLMERTGRGSVVGVTSGSGWRAADAGAYSAAKRAVAALTWQLGTVAPEGVSVNAISPIAMTRMVAAAMARAKPAASGSSQSTGGLSLGGMPEPEDLAPLGAWLCGDGAERLRGRILFTGGSEVAVVEAPRLLEVVRTDGAGSVDGVLDGVADAFAAAEAAQATSGGSNPRFPQLYERAEPADPDGAPSVAVINDRWDHGGEVVAALKARGVRTSTIGGSDPSPVLTGASLLLAGGADGLDAVVITLSEPAARGDGWRSVVTSYDGLASRLRIDAAWMRAVVEYSADVQRPLRLIQLVDATTPAGAARAQAAAQLARASLGATDGRVAAFSVAVEAADQAEATAALTAHLAGAAGAERLAGAELVVEAGWVGLRSHPRPTGSLVYGGPELPPWFGEALLDLAGSAS